MIKIVSWNVNGIRAALKKGFADYVAREDPDVICLQETKARPEQVELWLPGHPHQVWNAAERPGYSGTAAFSKRPPLAVTRGLGRVEHDREGRVLTLEFPAVYVVSVYVPNAKRDLSRLAERMDWDRALLDYLQSLERRKPVVWCGDLNVAHEEIDLARPKDNAGEHGFTDEERAGFRAFVAAGFIDTFRGTHPGEPGHYTWWRQFGGARDRNVGWRIDYVMMSPALAPSLREAFIRPHVMGSDHCPVGVTLALDAA